MSFCEYSKDLVNKNLRYTLSALEDKTGSNVLYLDMKSFYDYGR